MTTVLSDQNFGNNTSQVEAAFKKHEAISTDIEARVSTVLMVDFLSTVDWQMSMIILSCRM